VGQPLTVSLMIGMDGLGDPLAAWDRDYTLTAGGVASLSSSGGTVTFGPGESAVWLALAAKNDNAVEGTEGFRISLPTPPDASYQVGTSSGSGGSSLTDVRITDVQGAGIITFRYTPGLQQIFIAMPDGDAVISIPASNGSTGPWWFENGSGGDIDTMSFTTLGAGFVVVRLTDSSGTFTYSLPSAPGQGSLAYNETTGVADLDLPLPGAGALATLLGTTPDGFASQALATIASGRAQLNYTDAMARVLITAPSFPGVFSGRGAAGDGISMETGFQTGFGNLDLNYQNRLNRVTYTTPILGGDFWAEMAGGGIRARANTTVGGVAVTSTFDHLQRRATFLATTTNSEFKVQQHGAAVDASLTTRTESSLFTAAVNQRGQAAAEFYTRIAGGEARAKAVLDGGLAVEGELRLANGQISGVFNRDVQRITASAQLDNGQASLMFRRAEKTQAQFHLHAGDPGGAQRTLAMNLDGSDFRLSAGVATSEGNGAEFLYSNVNQLASFRGRVVSGRFAVELVNALGQSSGTIYAALTRDAFLGLTYNQGLWSGSLAIQLPPDSPVPGVAQIILNQRALSAGAVFTIAPGANLNLTAGYTFAPGGQGHWSCQAYLSVPTGGIAPFLFRFADQILSPWP
jgi:hypothetical protein